MRSLALLTALLLASPVSAAVGCDEGSVLTLIGMDTRGGEMLFVVSEGESEAVDGGLLELTAGADMAVMRPRAEGQRFAGSIGPGPVFAVARCGAGCLQAEKYAAGSWSAMGEPLTVPPGATVHTTHDTGGHPWMVVHRFEEIETAGGPRRRMRAWAYRFDGREWVSRGSLPVLAVGSPGAVPAPDGDAVLSGTGRFSANEQPRTWISSIPRLEAGIQGQVFALPAPVGAALLYTSDGEAFLTTDGGDTWRRSAWAPLNATREGVDLELDLPVGDRRGTFTAIWVERRPLAGTPEEADIPELLHLSELQADQRWATLGELPSSVALDTGGMLNFDYAFVPRPGRWTLLAGCAGSAAAPGLIVRDVDDSGVGGPRFVPIRR